MSRSLKLLNTQEVAELFGCTRQNIQRLIRESKLTPINPYHSNGYLFDQNYIAQEANKRKEAHHE